MWVHKGLELALAGGALALGLVAGCGKPGEKAEPAQALQAEAAPQAAAPRLKDDDAPPQARAGGKYAELLAVLPAPEAAQTRGFYADLGLQKTPVAGGRTDLADAYWVYVAPDWYVWGKLVEPELKAPPGADASGRYSGLLKVVPALEDRGQYGGFHDDGFNDRSEYKGIRDIPRGYWVYLAPNWYVWSEVKPLPLSAPPEARLDGRYDQLLRVIPAPDEQETLGKVKDGGRREIKDYKGATDIPPGYWVYVAPNWYVWGVSTTPGPQSGSKATTP
jgi:hypothetical protein